MSKVDLYAIGIVCCSACAVGDMTREQVEEAVNRQHPTGISSRWCVSDDKTFRDGTTNPCNCDQMPDRKHWLLVC